MKLLICKDNKNNNLLESRILQETDNIKYEIVENAPEIEKREGFSGHYVLNKNGEIEIEYIEVQPTKQELLEKRLSEMQEIISGIIYGDVTDTRGDITND